MDKPTMSEVQKTELIAKMQEQEDNLIKLKAVVEASKAAGIEMVEIDRTITQGENMLAVLKKLIAET